MDWPEMYCTHCTWTGRTCIVLIVHGLARPVLYPLLTGWPAVGYNPTLGLRDTINPVLGLRGADQGLEAFIYYLGSFFEEILNMMAVKINIAYKIGFFQSGMELDGINGRTLPDLDDS